MGRLLVFVWSKHLIYGLGCFTHTAFLKQKTFWHQIFKSHLQPHSDQWTVCFVLFILWFYSALLCHIFSSLNRILRTDLFTYAHPFLSKYLPSDLTILLILTCIIMVRSGTLPSTNFSNPLTCTLSKAVYLIMFNLLWNWHRVLPMNVEEN